MLTVTIIMLSIVMAVMIFDDDDAVVEYNDEP